MGPLGAPFLFSMLTPVIIQDHDHPALMSAWLARAKSEMPSVHPNRLQQWASGRVALSLAFAAQGVALGLTDHFDDFQRVRELPAWRFSLSHTQGFAAALVAPKARSIGIDIEPRERAVAEGIVARMHHEADELSLSALERWCAKEAIFKALPAELQQQIWLNSIALKRGEFSVQGYRGVWRGVPHAQLMVALAELQ